MVLFHPNLMYGLLDMGIVTSLIVNAIIDI